LIVKECRQFVMQAEKIFSACGYCLDRSTGI